MYNEAVKKAHDKYVEKHREKVKEYNRLYFKKRRNEDDEFRLALNKKCCEIKKKNIKKTLNIEHQSYKRKRNITKRRKHKN